jgi:hypothetical protein
MVPALSKLAAPPPAALVAGLAADFSVGISLQKHLTVNLDTRFLLEPLDFDLVLLGTLRTSNHDRFGSKHLTFFDFSWFLRNFSQFGRRENFRIF